MNILINYYNNYKKMEESISSPQTPFFGNPNKNINFSELLKMELDHKLKVKHNTEIKKKTKRRKSKSKSKTQKHNSEQLSLCDLNLENENPYYELLIKKIIIRNDFDKKHSKKFLSEIEEAFEGCNLNDEISEDDS